ncbi:MAG: alpha/beta hydrolase, partial [Rhodococcus sp. (in: high G+C Gram-positive bacteria)]
VIAPDLLGCGFTDSLENPGPEPMNEMLDHLGAFLDTFGLDRVDLLGTSRGGLLVSNLYLRDLERFRSLTAVCSEVALGGTTEMLTEKLGGSRANAGSYYDNPDLANVRRTMANVVYDIDTVSDAVLLMQMTSAALPGAPAAYARRAGGTAAHGVVNADFYSGEELGRRLGAAAGPFLGIWGADDPRGNKAAADNVAHLVPHGEYAVFDRCGHFPYLEQPEKFNRIVDQFLRRIEE